jgi:hypothetical protein
LREFGSGNAQSYNDIETSVAAMVGDIEVLRINHHGSAHSSNTSFLNMLDPEFSIVSSGSNNYGHPAKDAVSRLEGTSRIFVTTGADESIWSPTEAIWPHVLDGDIEIAVFDKGARYQIANVGAESFDDSEEAKQMDSPGAPSPTAGGGLLMSWTEAPNHVGEAVTVEGEIVRLRVLKNIAFLNFSPQYWRDLTVVIFATDFGNFPTDLAAAYLNRRVRVRGVVTEFEGRPQIVIQQPSQIVVQ